MTSSIDDFYDPALYEERVGPGNRVGPVYLKLAQERGGPVLELGCGTGDVLIPIAKAGITSYGVDASARMIAGLQKRLSGEPETARRNILLSQGDMAALEALNLQVKFQQIFIPNDTIAHMLSADDLSRTLLGSFRLIRPGGRFAFDVSPFDIQYLARFVGNESETFRFRGRYPSTSGEIIQVSERTGYALETGVLQADFKYEYLLASGELQRTVHRTLRLCPRRVDEYVFALKAAGFGPIQVSSMRPDGLEGSMILADRPVDR